MIVRRLRLNPFAGISDLELALDPGLNVVLGPNEAGKSTLVNALKMALFTPTTCGKRQFEREVEPFIPLAGGDTIRVETNVAADGRVYELSKTWGRQRGESRIAARGGELLTDPAAVQDKVQELLRVKEGTYKRILFSYQAGLAGTLESLSQDRAPSHDLAAILRKAVFETDGVSVDRLEETIRAEHEEYFSRWDPDLRRPQGGRGVEKPYQRGVGKVLSAYYAKESLRREVKRALEFEEDLDELNKSVAAVSDEVGALESFVGTNKEAVKDARRRALLEAQRRTTQKEEVDLRQVSLKWPALRQEIKGLGERIEELINRVKILDEELAKAKELEEGKKKLEIFKRAEKKKRDLDDAGKTLSETKRIEKRDFLALEKLHGELTGLRTSLKAGAISLSVTAAKPLELDVNTDLDGQRACRLKAGETAEFSAGGQIEIEHRDWTMKVKSGETDFENVRERFERISDEYGRTLKRLDVADSEECKTLYELYSRQVERHGLLGRELEEILEGHKYEDLEAVAGSAAGQGARPVATVAEEQGRVGGQITHLEDEKKEKENQLGEWAKQYDSPDNLVDLLVGKRRELEKLDDDLRALRPLPESYEDAGSFIAEFEVTEGKLRERQGELSQLLITRAELAAVAPEESREEIEVRLRDAESEYERVESEAGAVAEILETFKAIKADMDDQTMDPWLAEMQKIVAPLTVDRYTRVDLAGAGAPVALRSDGLGVPYGSLSMGTKVGLGLALRLSMAKYFLKDTDGFLVLDDPLVDLDPDRQGAAVAVIRDFAMEKQVILVTCHPRHAELLGGNLIRLGPAT
jgi:exonuclease SbcC